MNKRVKSLIMCLASIVGVSAMAGACGQIVEPHEHEYAEKWMADAEGHWHEATCECEDVTPVKVAHVDENNDAVCDVCAFVSCEHTYAEEWSSDANTHWHAADCGHDVGKADEAAHADADENGKCDVCDYQVGEPHEHTYATEWSHDEEYHWHAPSCGHEVEVVDKAAHNLNEAGDCTICLAHIKDVDTLDIEAVLAAAMANEGKIKSGSVTAIDAVYGGTGKETLETGKTNKVTFELGEGTSYIKWESYDKTGEFIGVEEQWHQALSEEEFFGVVLENGAEKKAPMASAAQFLKGYTYFPGSILGADSDDTSTLANTFMGLYNKMKAGVRVSDAVEGYEEESGKYVFAYTYYSVNPHTTNGVVYNVELEYYNVAVTFSVNEDMVIDAADWYVEVYRDYENDSDLDYTYVDNGDGTVTISDLKLKDTANPSFYTYQVTQESGERTYVNPYVKENIIPNTFELTHVTGSHLDENNQLVIDEEVEIGESIEILTGEYVKFHISGFLPETADPAFLDSSDFEYSFVNKDANSTAVCWNVNDTLLNGYSAYSQMLKLKILDVGEYTVTIKLGNLEKVFDVKVIGEGAPDLGEDDENTVNVATTDTNCYIDEYSYTAAEDGTYTFNLPAGLGLYSVEAYDSWGEPECDVFNPSVDSSVAHSVEVQLAAGETYKFYVGATTKASWVITVSFEAGEVGGGDEGGDDPVELPESALTIGNNSNNAADVKYVYTAEEAGTLTLSFGGWVAMGGGSTANCKMTYVVNGGEATAIEAGVAATLTLAVGDKVEVSVIANGCYTTLKAEWAETSGGEDEVVYGTQDNPFVLQLGTQELEITESFVETNNYAYCALEVTQTGWYSFNEYWNYSGDVLESPNGVWIYAEAGTTLLVSKYVDVAGPMTAIVALESTIDVSAGSGDSAANGIAINGVGVYAINADYAVSADGVYVNFTANETGYYSFTFSNFNNTLTYDNVEYCSNGDNGDLMLYAQAGNTYSFLLNNIGYDDDYNMVQTSGVLFFNVAAVPALTVGENTVVGAGEEFVGVVISVETSGAYTISIEDKGAESIRLWGDLICIDGYNPWGVSAYSTVVELEAGTVYKTSVFFPTDENWNPISGSWTITIEAGGSTEVAETALVMDDNAINAADVTYAYTAEEAGTLTLTAGGAVAGMVEISYTVNDGESTVLELNTSVELTLVAGDKVVITVVAEGYSTLTAAWLGESGSTGEEGGDEEEGQGTASNPYVVTGATSFVISADYYNAIYVQVSAGVTVSLDCAAQFVTEADGPLGTTVTPTEDTVYMIYADSMAGVMGQLTATVGEVSSEEALKIGSTSVELKSAVYAYTATADGTLTLTAGGALMDTPTFNYTLNGGDAVSFAAQESVAIELVAGDKVVVSIVADSCYTSITAAWAAKPDGTEGNPYVIDTLPADLTVEYKGNSAAGMVWYKFTVAEGGTLTLTFDGTDNWFYVNQGTTQVFSGGSAAQLSYTTSLSAGEYMLGIATWSENAATLQVNVALEVISSGGETTDGVVTYMSAKHASGRYLKVTIDATAGTMTLVRSNMSGGWDASTSTAEYSYAFDGTTVTATNVSGQVCTFTWNADGTPAFITWGSAVFTDFTVQA